MANKKRPAQDFWCIKLRNGDEYEARVDRDYLSFNTMKFASYEAALAHARGRNLNPIDHVIVLARFEWPKVLKTREIDYGTTDISVAG